MSGSPPISKTRHSHSKQIVARRSPETVQRPDFGNGSSKACTLAGRFPFMAACSFSILCSLFLNSQLLILNSLRPRHEGNRTIGLLFERIIMPLKSSSLVREQGSPTPPKKSASPSGASSHRRLSVAVAAQPALFCEVLSRQLEAEPSFAVVGRASSVEQVGKLLAKENPQILVFDYEGLGPNAETTVHRLRRTAPATRILVLATRSSDETVERVLRAGASGLVGKQLEFSVLVRAISAVAAGEIWANRRATSLALENLTGRSARASKSDLTKREQEIAEACGRGMRNKEIAKLLNISAKTVKGHLNNIFRKLQVDSRFALGLHIMENVQPKS